MKFIFELGERYYPEYGTGSEALRNELFNAIRDAKLTLEGNPDLGPMQIPLRDGNGNGDPAIEAMVKRTSDTRKNWHYATISFPVYFGDKENWKHGDHQIQVYALRFSSGYTQQERGAPRRLELLDARGNGFCKDLPVISISSYWKDDIPDALANRDPALIKPLDP